ncbi:MAG: GNAT family N-acetyltransferase [Pyrinomonadaceae bacterium]|nr:GNAT family N-acetyltransferase [Pyrinomonadaceae bacterium]
MFESSKTSGLVKRREEAPPDVRIRRAIADDAVSIASVLYESFLEYESSYTPEAFAATVSSPGQILERLSEGPVWVALTDGKVIGTVSAVVKAEGLYIRGMAVKPSGRGSGIGERLLKCAEDFAIENGCTRLFLSTTPFLARAIRLYEQSGFSRNNEGPHELWGTPLFTMVKDL